MTVATTGILSVRSEQPRQAEKSSAPQRSKARAQALKQHMMDSLADTTELSALQERLLNSLTQGIGLDGLHYHNEALALDIQLGQQVGHSCGYRLLCTDEYLGEIIFKRRRRFSERELELIESVIPALVSPLRKSLRSQQD
ncbi:hypothetical protein [Pseudohongiella spirulinae]|uniref:Uncharacterized protein n=1 Tax=Pseudohongiella spirulinae TaxID=1249552 RepID=A0A0S2KD95_9GAMM|nr:hypothetical protein [Pseudohongiella spirulinae]ALO46294.1 hypothetical protein PS2015_1642 [Pseudohongiella spirulinae]